MIFKVVKVPHRFKEMNCLWYIVRRYLRKFDIKCRTVTHSDDWQMRISLRLFRSTRKLSSKYTVSNHPLPTGGNVNVGNQENWFNCSVAVSKTNCVRMIGSSDVRNIRPVTPKYPLSLTKGIVLIIVESELDISCVISLDHPLSKNKLISFSVVQTRFHFRFNCLDSSSVEVIGESSANESIAWFISSDKVTTFKLESFGAFWTNDNRKFFLSRWLFCRALSFCFSFDLLHIAAIESIKSTRLGEFFVDCKYVVTSRPPKWWCVFLKSSLRWYRLTGR